MVICEAHLYLRRSQYISYYYIQVSRPHKMKFTDTFAAVGWD